MYEVRPRWRVVWAHSWYPWYCVSREMRSVQKSCLRSQGSTIIETKVGQMSSKTKINSFRHNRPWCCAFSVDFDLTECMSVLNDVKSVLQ